MSNVVPCSPLYELYENTTMAISIFFSEYALDGAPSDLSSNDAVATMNEMLMHAA